jgi:flagellar motility protein MotE (MotC chaperone)
MPRLLPLVGVALGGLLAVKALSGAGALPDLLHGAQAFAEGAVKPPASASAASDKSAAPVLPPGLSLASNGPGSPGAIAAATAAPAAPTPLACGPKAADLAKEAGLSPAELQILQSLGARRGQLDQREADIDAQTQLLNAAEAKLDTKLAALAAMKGDIQNLLNQTDQQKSAEIDRLVIVYSQMKPKDAATRMSLLNDATRLPIATKMKERALSAVLGQMAPADARDITEKLAHRFESQAVADARSALNGQAPPASSAPAQQAAAGAPGAQAPAAGASPAQPGQTAAAPAKPAKVAKAKPRRKAKATSLAANQSAPSPAPASPAAAKPASTPPATPAAPAGTAPAKSG